MHTRKIIPLVALIGALCSAYALGQNTQANDTAQFEKDMREAESDLASGEWQSTVAGADKTTSLSEKAVGNPVYTRTMAKQVLSRYYSQGDPKALARLEALQVMQNARIIELLEKQAAKEK